MKHAGMLLAILVTVASPVSTGAGSESLDGKNQGRTSSIPAMDPEAGKHTEPALPQMETSPVMPSAGTAAPLYDVDWYSVNAGGDHNLTGTNFDLGVSVGEAVAGFSDGAQYNLGLGFWYGATAGACPIVMTGDVNLNGTLGGSDIITMVNFVLKGGPPPLPCVANGDTNCDGLISASDIVVLINRVLKAGPDPCNVCNIIPSTWSCP